jgi:flagellar basal-body rod modification protein FlgD
MTVSSIDNSSQGAYTAAASGVNSSSQEDQFLQLLITQIQNQDPLNPMDNAQFTSQLTQLSSLDQLEMLNSNMEQNIMYSQSLNNTMMLGVVGHTATVPGSDVALTDGAASRNSITTGAGGTATVKILDEDGVEVTSFTEAVTYGTNDIIWNGEDKNGDVMPDGTYTMEIDVVDSAGDALAFDSYMTGVVDSIRFENNTAVMNINGTDYYAAEILEIGI